MYKYGIGLITATFQDLHLDASCLCQTNADEAHNPYNNPRRTKQH